MSRCVGKLPHSAAEADLATLQFTDPFGRPQEKVRPYSTTHAGLADPHLQILLLCGPPGLGKTTLAHVLAKQAGYQVLEVNASDDRTGRVVEDRIRNALESRALTTGGGLSGSKPTCVIVDEVDGAGGGGESVSWRVRCRRPHS